MLVDGSKPETEMSTPKDAPPSGPRDHRSNGAGRKGSRAVSRIGCPSCPSKYTAVATNSSVEGEATAVYLEGVIRPLGPKITRLARGLPVGSELEYVDGSTIIEAMAGRREM